VRCDVDSTGGTKGGIQTPQGFERIGRAIVFIQGEQSLHPDSQRSRKIRTERSERRKAVLQVGRQHLTHTGAVEGPHESERLVENTAKRVKIGSQVELLVVQLLGRHHVDRADHRAALVHGLQGGGLHQARLTEIKDLRPVASRGKLNEHDVSRLDVAMDDVFFMGRSETLQTLRREMTERFLGQRLDEFLERLPLHEFHNEQHFAALLEHIVDRHDIRMLETRQNGGLLEEHVVRGGNPFDRHPAGQGGVVGEIDRTRPTRSKHLIQSITAVADKFAFGFNTHGASLLGKSAMETRGIVLEAIKQQRARGIVMFKVVGSCLRLAGFVSPDQVRGLKIIRVFKTHKSRKWPEAFRCRNASAE
jgi:hypothetical protein